MQAKAKALFEKIDTKKAELFHTAAKSMKNPHKSP